MKLIIKRDQKAQKGLFGGHQGMRFLLSCRVELTSGEQDLVNRYNTEDWAFTYITGSDGSQFPDVTLRKLKREVTEEMMNIGMLLDKEEEIKKACSNFKILLEVMSTFGGEEVIEFGSVGTIVENDQVSKILPDYSDPELERLVEMKNHSEAVTYLRDMQKIAKEMNDSKALAYYDQYEKIIGSLPSSNSFTNEEITDHPVYCKQCGNPLKAVAKFCTKCGTPRLS
jgi:hypothetical protein